MHFHPIPSDSNVRNKPAGSRGEPMTRQQNLKRYRYVFATVLIAIVAGYFAYARTDGSAVMEDDIDFKKVFLEAEQRNTGKSRLDAEPIAAEIAHDWLVKKFPAGSDAADLTRYLEEKGFICSSYEKPMAALQGGRNYCEFKYNHWLPVTDVIWKVITYSDDAERISDIRILAQLNTL